MFTLLKNLKEIPKNSLRRRKGFYGSDFLMGPKRLIFKIIRFYQNFISPNLGQNCRFYPSCSEYTYQSIEKYGAISGCWKGLKRICKCYPWHPGGVDLP